MYSFDLNVLFFPSILIALFTFFISNKLTKSIPLSLLACFLKAGLFLIYFGILFDGTYTFNDDITYLNGGLKIINRDITIFNIYDEWLFIERAAGGRHVGYILYNAFAISLFGDYYFSPIVLNIILTSIIAYIGANLAKNELDLNKKSLNLFYLFILFHPDILSWSTITNLKDIIVLFFHLVLLSAGADFLNKKIKTSLWKVILSFIILSTIRFYVPFLIALALIISLIFSKKVKSRLTLMIFGGGLLLFAILSIGFDQIINIIQDVRAALTNPIIGFIRATLTPIPFNTEAEYAFLNLPALFHWCLLPLTILGFQQIWRIKTPFSMFFITYLLIFLGLYGIYEELQGPRHRVQLDFAIALLQYIGIIYTFKFKTLIKVNYGK